MGNIFHKLAKKILNGAATKAEQRFMDVYYHAFDNVKGREDVLTAEEQTALRDHIDKGIQSHIQRKRTIRLRKWIPYAAAAAILVVMGSMWVLFSDDKQEVRSESILAAEEILPGGHRATLTLANGRTIDLSEAQTGIIVAEENITYSDGDTLLVAPSETLVLTTPKGGTYQITLADGTKVWLNAATTLRYPSRFDEAERLVEVSGEAYFAVAKDKSRPFKVKSSGQVIEVLGTAFNISAYPEENEIKTTLVEGAVQLVNLASNSVDRLRPGEQAVVSGSTTNISNVSIDPFTAWKDGFFYFDNVQPQKAIEQVARWYDLEVVYDGKPSESSVFGMIERSKPLDAVLKSFAKSGLDFEVRQRSSDKRLIVRRKINNK